MKHYVKNIMLNCEQAWELVGLHILLTAQRFSGRKIA